jgi:hypothetical protein
LIYQCSKCSTNETTQRFFNYTHYTHRGCAANLIHECGKSFEVMGNVMPGSGELNITQATKNKIN